MFSRLIPALITASTASPSVFYDDNVISMLQKRAREVDHVLAADNQDPGIGKSSCPCVGINNKSGFTEASIQGQTVLYPADTGSRCEAWDYGRYPGCGSGTGSLLASSLNQYADENASLFENMSLFGNESLLFGNDSLLFSNESSLFSLNDSNGSSLYSTLMSNKSLPAFCSDAWCYVDPCNCNLPTAPKASGYFPNATFQGRTLYYSYATCAEKDTFTDEKKAAEDKAALKKECASETKATNIGAPTCRCIGIANRSGTTYLNYGGDIGVVSYPGEVGTYCSAWEAASHPDCSKDKAPSWCNDAWCYVDPCACDVGTTPKVTMAMEGASFQGKSLYYSYKTCGASDSFTSSEYESACVNQKDEDKCGAQKKCAWTGSKCVGKDLAKICK